MRAHVRRCYPSKDAYHQTAILSILRYAGGLGFGVGESFG